MSALTVATCPPTETGTGSFAPFTTRTSWIDGYAALAWSSGTVTASARTPSPNQIFCLSTPFSSRWVFPADGIVPSPAVLPFGAAWTAAHYRRAEAKSRGARSLGDGGPALHQPARRTSLVRDQRADDLGCQGGQALRRRHRVALRRRHARRCRGHEALAHAGRPRRRGLLLGTAV